MANQYVAASRQNRDVLENISDNKAVETKQDPLARYHLSDFDCDSSPIYLGKLDTDGKWFITKLVLSTEEVTYTKGDTDYTTNWLNRASLTYDLFNNIF